MTVRPPASPSVARFAQERVQPLVSKMDEESQMDKGLIDELFQNGVSEAPCVGLNYIVHLSMHQSLA